ncbi:MAG TPA: PAS domain S-box protein, partial [Eubacteriaceae bacterium]|nr:PAS domain S-box protein [Eubacteriaceae bacterium]
MSEHINNSQQRKEKLKELILKLHDGENFEEVKEEFQKQFEHVSATEITEI